jgi:hypothetical protein
MSRAFVKEADNQAPDLLDRPVSPHRNFVTPEGLVAIEGALVRFEAAHRAAIDNGDQQAAASALREVRYWRARRSSAEVVKPPADKTEASFGTTVRLRRDNGREQTFRMLARMRPIRPSARFPMRLRSRMRWWVTGWERQSRLPDGKPSSWRLNRGAFAMRRLKACSRLVCASLIRAPYCLRRLRFAPELRHSLTGKSTDRGEVANRPGRTLQPTAAAPNRVRGLRSSGT